MEGLLSVRWSSATAERSLAGHVDGGRGSLSYHLGGLYRKTDDYSIPGHPEASYEPTDPHEGHEEHEQDEHQGAEDEGILPNSSAETSRLVAGLSYVHPAGFFGVSVSGYDTEYGIPGGHLHPGEPVDHGEDGQDEADVGDVAVDLTQRRVDLEGAWRFGDSFARRIRARFGVSDYEHFELVDEPHEGVHELETEKYNNGVGRPARAGARSRRPRQRVCRVAGPKAGFRVLRDRRAHAGDHDDPDRGLPVRDDRRIVSHPHRGGRTARSPNGVRAGAGTLTHRRSHVARRRHPGLRSGGIPLQRVALRQTPGGGRTVLPWSPSGHPHVRGRGPGPGAGDRHQPGCRHPPGRRSCAGGRSTSFPTPSTTSSIRDSRERRGTVCPRSSGLRPAPGSPASRPRWSFISATAPEPGYHVTLDALLDYVRAGTDRDRGPAPAESRRCASVWG